MLIRLRSIYLFSLFLFVSCSVFSMTKAKSQRVSTTVVKAGPILRFQGQHSVDKEDGKKAWVWKVSAEYVVKTGFLKRYPEDSFAYYNYEKRLPKGKVLGTKYGYDFVRFDMEIPQESYGKIISYGLQNDPEYKFSVPGVGQPANILSHSCNGGQSEEDRLKLGGFDKVWGEVNRVHREKNYHVQLPLGDQVYADGQISENTPRLDVPGIGEIFGIFALETMQQWWSNNEYEDIMRLMEFDEDMIEDVDHFYFNHYMEQFNLPEFKMAMATIPAASQPDDHDYFDGCGSYPSYLQDSYVMRGVRKIAQWYANVVQHHLSETEFPTGGFNFMYTVDEGKTAILGIDTRSERTRKQVVSDATWDKVFGDLMTLPQNTKHLVVMLGIPVVYADTSKLEAVMTCANGSKFVSYVLNCVAKSKNILGREELDDDLHDEWALHKQERDKLITRLQEIAAMKNMRATLLSGDVHTACAGHIYSKSKGKADQSATKIWQVTTSPIGNAPLDAKTAAVIYSEAVKQNVGKKCSMCMFPLKEVDREDHQRWVLNKRNFVSLYVDDKDILQVQWTAEHKPWGKHKDDPYQHYNLSIPSLTN